MIFPFSFLGTGTGSFVFSSRFSRRKLCSRRIVLAHFGKPETQTLFFFLFFFFFIYLFIYFYFAFNGQLPNSKSYLNHKKTSFMFGFPVSIFPFGWNCFNFTSSRNSRRDRELFLVPESRCREGDENSFHENSGNCWEMAGKSCCLVQWFSNRASRHICVSQLFSRVSPKNLKFVSESH
jgi:hypothetical protein